MTTIINDNLIRTFEKAAHDHVYWVMANKGLFLKPMNFSTTQYMWLGGMKSAVKFNEIVHTSLVELAPNSTFLDMGIAAGYLELVNRLKGKPLEIKTIEWDEQLECCTKVREAFGVNVDYVCNTIYDENFEIEGCEKRDYIILERFFPVYHTNDFEKIREIFHKLSKYAYKAIIVECDNNWSKGIFEQMIEVSEVRIRLSETWQMVVTDLEQFR